MQISIIRRLHCSVCGMLMSAAAEHCPAGICFSKCVEHLCCMKKICLSQCVCRVVMSLQIGDCRGLGGLAQLMWHELEMKIGVYSAKVSGCLSLDCSPSKFYQLARCNALLHLAVSVTCHVLIDVLSCLTKRHPFTD